MIPLPDREPACWRSRKIQRHLALPDPVVKHSFNWTFGTHPPNQPYPCRFSSLPSDMLEHGFEWTLMQGQPSNEPPHHPLPSDMLEHGFEWTLMQGQPSNQAPHRYKVAPACCRMSFNEKDRKCVRDDAREGRGKC